MENNFQTKSLFIALVGRPNVGKSSLLNALIGDKIAIVTKKPQTTRSRITGILTVADIQYVFLDTPGIHKPRTKLGERMVRTVGESVADVDLVVMLFEPYGELNEAERELIQSIEKHKVDAIAVINKTDTLKTEADLTKRMVYLFEQKVFNDVLFMSVIENKGVDVLLANLEQYAQIGPHFFPDDSITDLPEKTIVAEIIREKTLTYLYDEIPHGIAVVVESFKERPDKNMIDIDVSIFCEKKSHKGMIIGKNGAMLKKIASAARVDIEAFLDVKVNLQCWVKVKDDWRDNDFLLNNFGYQKNR